MSVLDDLTPGDRDRLRAADHPDWVPPMLATLTDDRFSRSGWLFERKFDGVRCLAFRDGERVRLRSRNRKDQGATYPEIVDAIGVQPATDVVLDGEIVAFDGATTSFERLQARSGITDPQAARRSGIAVIYYVFDVMHLDGHDLRHLGLRRRKALLKRALAFEDPLRLSTHRDTDGHELFAAACEQGWEGLVAKADDAPYRGGRSRSWLKFKCEHGQELVIGGYTEPEGSRTDFGALLLGYYEDGHLVYAGRVGTGFDAAMLDRLGAQLRDREQARPPFTTGTGDLPDKGVHWVRPELVGEVGFTEWTRDGRLRHPRFLGLRTDKNPGEVVRERPS